MKKEEKKTPTHNRPQGSQQNVEQTLKDNKIDYDREWEDDRL